MFGQSIVSHDKTGARKFPQTDSGDAMITVLGAKGSMGRRYQAILTSLGQHYVPIDLNTLPLLEHSIKNSTHVIVATPTDKHIEHIKEVLNINPDVRILCEKPVTRKTWQIQDFRDTDLTVMMQYRMLDDKNNTGDSIYNYFNHGNDGLVWDCFQVVALARGDVIISDKSPVWSCTLNGKQLSIADMDKAYIDYVTWWLSGGAMEHSEIMTYHEKVLQYAAKFY